MERCLYPSLDGLAHGARNDNSTGWCLRLKSRCHIHIVAIDVIALSDDIAKVKTDPKHDGFVLGLVAIGIEHGLLEVDCCGKRIDGAGKLNQSPSTGQPDHSSATTCGSWREPTVKVFKEPRNGAALVLAHQPRRSDCVCKEDRCQSALLSGQRLSLVLLRQNRRSPLPFEQEAKSLGKIPFAVGEHRLGDCHPVLCFCPSA